MFTNRYINKLEQVFMAVFMYDRKLLAQLSKCAWKVINVFLKSAFSYDDAAPGAGLKYP